MNFNRSQKSHCDVLIIGAGVVGISVGIALLRSKPELKVVIVEKEKRLGMHSSGRNSGVLHAGFYYSPDSLKARFCKDGNASLRQLAAKYGVPVLNTGKVVVTQNYDEVTKLKALFQRGLENGVDIELFDSVRLRNYESLATTVEKFLWSPTTGVSDPRAIIEAFRREFTSMGGEIHFETTVEFSTLQNEVVDLSNRYHPNYVVNAAGAYSNSILRELGLDSNYAMIPFMGVYRATSNKSLPLKTLVYPVPHPINPFLGVHFTLTVDGKVKIGPTAIPVLGKVQYSIWDGWSINDVKESLTGITALIRGETHDVRSLFKSELPKLTLKSLVEASSALVPAARGVDKWKKNPPGIRAQLINLRNGKLEQDFIVTKKLNSIHILNAVSPGWTSAIPFGEYVANLIPH
jgi:L-2-hydroxyglutarate oxidase LhgO